MLSFHSWNGSHVGTVGGRGNAVHGIKLEKGIELWTYSGAGRQTDRHRHTHPHNPVQQTGGTQIVQKFSWQPEVLGPSRVTRSTFRIRGPKIISDAVQILVARATAARAVCPLLQTS